jgi:tetratricopeptide (TPR) repeat protein
VEQSARAASPGDTIAPRQLEEAPDWLSELRPQADAPEEPAAEAEQATAAEEQSAWQEPQDDLNKLDWLSDLGEPESEEPIDAEPAPAIDNTWLPEAELAASSNAAAPMPEPATPTAQPASRTSTLRGRTATLRAAEQAEAPQRLEQARQALNYGKLNEAADQYSHLLRRRLVLDDVIADLSAAVRRHGNNATLWQTLGDAYMRNNQLREALDCYTKAEDLL